MLRFASALLLFAVALFPTGVLAETSSDNPTDRPGGRDCRNVIASRNQDRDGDTLSDGREYHYGTSATRADTDNDLLDDGVEVFLGTDPLRPDTDGNGLRDGCEFRSWNKVVSPFDPRVFDPDSDGDTLPDALELYYQMNPNDRDTDDDTLYDNEEWVTFDCNSNKGDSGPPQAKNPDSDGDGIGDGVEVKSLGTNPRKPDTDGDGYGDWGEIYTHGTEPTDPADHPNPVLYPPDHP